MNGLLSDLRWAARCLLRRPGFSALVVVTLGLGLGATSTIYSVVDALLLRSLPYQDSERLVAVGNTFPGREWDDERAGLQHLAGVSYQNFAELESRARAFDALAGAERRSALLPDRGDGPELVPMMAVTESFFDLLSVTPALGRGFLPDDFAPGGPEIVLLSHASWRDRHGADPLVVGGKDHGSGATIVGVLPAGFRAPEALAGRGVELWIPLDGSHPRYLNRGRRSMYLFGRLAPSTTVAAARQEVELIGVSLAAEFPEGSVYPDGSHLGYGVNSLHAETVGTAGKPLMVFLAAAALLLLLACLNAANLLMLRGLDRAGEVRIRRALGAGGWRLTRQLLVESVALALAGGALGVALAYGGVAAFLRYGPANTPRMDEVAINPRVVLASLLVALLAGLLSGLLPSFGLVRGWRKSRQESTRTVASGARLRLGLVTAQLALALVLSVGASLLFHSFLKLRAVDPGFRSDGLFAFSMPMKRPGAADVPTSVAWDSLLDEVASVPGVDAVAAASNLPFESPNWAPWIQLPGDPPELVREGIAGYVVTRDYLSTAEIPLFRGRGFGPQDSSDGPRVALVNQAFASEHAAGLDPLGLRLLMRDEDDAGVEVRSSVEVVGVVGNVIQTRAQEGSLPAVYFPHTQVDWPVAKVLVRTERGDEMLAKELRQAAARFSPILPARNLRSMNDRIGRVRTEPRFQALLLSGFALIAVLLASVGLFGALAHAVGRRRRELGIRMALGADSAGIFGLVLRQGMSVAVIGVALGLVGAISSTRFLDRFLFEVGSLDLPTLAATVLALLGVAALAVLQPARRATRVDPALSLRAE